MMFLPRGAAEGSAMTFETTIGGYAFVVTYQWIDGAPQEITVTRNRGGDVYWWDWSVEDQKQIEDECRDHEQTMYLERIGG